MSGAREWARIDRDAATSDGRWRSKTPTLAASLEFFYLIDHLLS